MGQISSAGTGQRGQALLFVTISLPVLLGLIGFAVDLGWLYFQKEAATAAAQSAALAGATQVYKTGGTIGCNSGVIWCNSDPQQCSSTPNSPPQNSFDTACLYAKANGFQVTGDGKSNVTVEAGASTAPTAPHTSNSYYVTVNVTKQMPLTFLSVLGAGNLTTVTARATSGVNVASGGGCMYVLDPTKHKSYSMSGANFTTGCGIYVNSNQSDAAYMVGGNLTLNNSSTLTIHGQLNQLGGNITPSGSVKQNQPSTSDPFSGMTAPTVADVCQADPHISGGNTNNLNSGTYCGITVSGGNNITFNSGIYVLKTGNLTVNGGNFSTTATNVLFYIPSSNSTGKINITGGNMHWNGITGNGADGFVFWVANSAAQNITGGNYTINGVVYMPSSALTYNGGNGAQQTVVVNSATVNGGNITTPATSGLFSGGGLPGGAFLVE
ncbi:MAG TPA: pilus assembly protein TadG-related protein [Bryobacteraceae bacterium]|nr:pilus assembly protein TadG-related protein [Bryobacteraceae bacterium]